MARGSVFLSKRLIRFAVLATLFLLVIVSLNSRGSSSSSTAKTGSNVGADSNRAGVPKKVGISEDVVRPPRPMGLDQVNLEADVVVASKAPADKVPVAVTSASSTVDNKQEQALQEAPSVQDFIQEKTEEQQLEADLKANVKQTTMDFIKKDFANKGKRPKACFVTLVRNSELNGLLSSIRIVEQRFNAKFKYDWIFLNDEPFSEEFKKRVQEEVSSTVKFGLIPKEHWSYPDYIDQSKAADTRAKMADIIYGGSESYRHMCRYQSGFFWRHPLLDEYSWYWRVEPDTQLYCDINYDVFQWMQDHEKVYGFTITIHEYEATIPTLWKTSMNFFKEHPEYVSENNLMKFLSGNDGETYNLCHFWSNFEIASLDLWRSPAYRAYFDYLDRAGGFFYERWGDAPVHSIAAALMIPRDKIHYFSDIGYHHPPYDNCPRDMDVFRNNNCACDQGNDFTFQAYACGTEYYDSQGMTKPDNWKELHV